MKTKRTHNVFMRFNSIYGGTWSARYPTQRMYDEAIREWTQDLEKYSDDEIEQAIVACKQRHQLAPTLPQFLELVKAQHCQKYRPPVEKPKGGSREVAMHAIAQMRETLSQFEQSLGEDEQDGEK